MIQKVIIGTVLSILVILVLYLSKWGDKPEDPPYEYTDPVMELFTKRYEEHFREQFRKSKTPGAALVIVKDSVIVYAEGFGYESEDSHARVNVNTVFRIGSLSKSFAAVLTAVLAEEQQLGWNDRVIDYLPGFALQNKAQTDRVKIWHLLSHTTGLPTHAYTNLLDDGIDRARINAEFSKVPLNGKEGETFGYQNAAFALIEDVIFSATGTKFEDLLEQKIFMPLNMQHSSVTYDAMISEPNKAWPHEFNYRRKRFQKMDISDRYYNAASAGGVNTSILDLGIYLKLLLGYYPNVLSEYSLNVLFKPIVSTNSERNYYDYWKSVDASFYALGWRVHTYDGDTIIHHGGYVNGYRSELVILPSEKLGMCVLFNAPNSFSGRCIPDFIDLYHLYNQPAIPDTLMSP